ncbi:ZYRO0G03498p [Zygosaccharomyces rouxii]|uniref:ZYRO0G03498p n=1 Tax=Zygosaccharomyces rouxii (strain ATCC 2623 / CBS 732 / NBRC 1130 / NCYC 568 / NRRL Y-229) TaxID=559307 RepID=C5DZD6_ZYGRC|nr:uncharacterized protein ZYRO0G03498g [Zygosaccharomyces rouxii]KAH9202219.1 hypothetical protein LQ764DRAFT_232376 [Zygosaccharomyces rouxii]CAR29220.1 ZYRO0G03498p [Zygosaccharomyces rouxii]
MDQDDSEQAMPGVKQEIPHESSPDGISEPQDTEGGDEEGETRCICKELDPPDDSGLYIQCEQCGAWQHGYCVGISDGEDSYLEKYWCEQCKPELHRLYTVDSAGTLRSLYQPIQEKRRHIRRNSRQRPNSNPTSGSQLEDSQHDSSNSSLRETPEKNPTDDSRESRSRSSRSRRSLEKSIGNDIREADQDQENDGNNGHNNTNDNGKRNNSNSELDRLGESPLSEDPIEDGDEDDKKLQDRKRATFSAREEKHYQWMLEKAIRESRRTSKHEDDSHDAGDGQKLGLEADLTNEEVPDQAQESKESRTHQGRNDYWHNGEENVAVTENEHSQSPPVNLQEFHGYGASNSAANSGTSASGAAASATNRTRDDPLLSRSASMNSNSEDDSKRPKKSKRGPNRGNRSSGNGNGARASTPPKGKLELGVNKPMKPRLPSQRTSLNEMRRRVGAILEFISRTQWELSEDQSSRDDLIRFVENQQFVQQVDTIFESHDHTLKLMDDLTRSLLLWEKKYSNGPTIQD